MVGGEGVNPDHEMGGARHGVGVVHAIIGVDPSDTPRTPHQESKRAQIWSRMATAKIGVGRNDFLGRSCAICGSVAPNRYSCLRLTCLVPQELCQSHRWEKSWGDQASEAGVNFSAHAVSWADLFLIYVIDSIYDLYTQVEVTKRFVCLLGTPGFNLGISISLTAVRMSNSSVTARISRLRDHLEGGSSSGNKVSLSPLS